MFDESVYKDSCSWKDALGFCIIFDNTQCVVCDDFAVSARMEHMCIKFCAILGKSAIETLAVNK